METLTFPTNAETELIEGAPGGVAAAAGPAKMTPRPTAPRTATGTIQKALAWGRLLHARGVVRNFPTMSPLSVHQELVHSRVQPQSAREALVRLTID